MLFDKRRAVGSGSCSWSCSCIGICVCFIDVVRRKSFGSAYVHFCFLIVRALLIYVCKFWDLIEYTDVVPSLYIFWLIFEISIEDFWDLIYKILSSNLSVCPSKFEK